MSPAEVFGVYVVWREGKCNVCENRSGELLNKGYGPLVLLPPSLRSNFLKVQKKIFLSVHSLAHLEEIGSLAIS